MKIDFTNIDKHIVPISEFRLKWRFTEEKYEKAGYRAESDVNGEKGWLRISHNISDTPQG